jgi:GR25 family glycosyltransferase involved in LPS biosynthesis
MTSGATTQTGEKPGSFPDAYVINLARTPERLARFLRQNSGCGIDFRRFEAVDGSAISDEEAVRLNLIKPGTQWNSRGTIGVAMSHRRLWEATVAEGKPRLVFEDDAYVREDAAQIFSAEAAGLPKWDIILLGYNTDALVEFRVAGDFAMCALFAEKHPKAAQLERFTRARDPSALFRLRHAFGISGYAISPSGAEKLLAKCFPMDNRLLVFKAAKNQFNAFSIDCMMNAFYAEIDAYLFVGPLVLPLNDWQSSTITRVKQR